MVWASVTQKYIPPSGSGNTDHPSGRLHPLPHRSSRNWRSQDRGCAAELCYSDFSIIGNRSLCGVLRGRLSSRRLCHAGDTDMTSLLIECRGCYSPNMPLNTGNEIWAARVVARLYRGHAWVCRAVGGPDLPVLQSRAISAIGRQTLNVGMSCDLN
jgi:hypothetical protein